MTAEYRYFFADALTGTLLEELPLACQSITQQINDVGTLTGTLPLGDLGDLGGVAWRTCTEPLHNLCVVQRDDQLVWGGIVNKRRVSSGGTAAEISAVTLEGWLANQELQADLTYGSSTDVFTIVRGIVAQIQGVTGGNLRITSGANPAGYLDVVTYLGKDSTKALDAINKLAEAAPGFEYTFTWSRTGSVFTPTMTLATPGLAVTLDPILIEFPGSLADYTYDEDPAVNSMTGVGADSGGSPLLARITDSTQIGAGYPIWYGQIQAKDETLYTRLSDRTQAALTAAVADHVVPTAVLRADSDPHFGDFPIGCPARLRATSLYHPAGVNGAPGLDVTRRVTGWTVTPAPAEKVSLTLGSTTGKLAVPARSRTTIAYLAQLEKRVRALEST